MLAVAIVAVPPSASASWSVEFNTFSTGGKGLDGQVSTMARFSGDLIVAGKLNNAGTGLGTQVAVHGIAQWDGSHWSPMGSGLAGVRALDVHTGSLRAA